MHTKISTVFHTTIFELLVLYNLELKFTGLSPVEFTEARALIKSAARVQELQEL